MEERGLGVGDLVVEGAGPVGVGWVGEEAGREEEG